MPTYDICGVPVDFPFEAYAPQLVYMEKVVLALEQGQVSLVESGAAQGSPGPQFLASHVHGSAAAAPSIQ